MSPGSFRRRVEIATRPEGGCYTQQPQRVASAFRVIGSTRDFTHSSNLANPDDDQWLSFDMNG
jgi:hypothetical protein